MTLLLIIFISNIHEKKLNITWLNLNQTGLSLIVGSSNRFKVFCPEITTKNKPQCHFSTHKVWFLIFGSHFRFLAIFKK